MLRFSVITPLSLALLFPSLATAFEDLLPSGPGTVLASFEAAAIDALTYAYLKGNSANDAERMRGGTIQRDGNGYSYREIHVADPGSAHRIAYSLTSQDVARFQIYPKLHDHDANRVNERISRADRRSVSVIDPLHRPLYILHPSLVIRAYRGDAGEHVEVANLTQKPRSRVVAAPIRHVSR